MEERSSIAIQAQNPNRKGFGIPASTNANQFPIRVLLVDDHPMVLKGLSQSLTESAQLEVVDTANCGAEAIQRFRALRPDVVLLDLTLPDMSGLQVLRILRAELNTSKVIIYTMHNNKEYVRECLSLGASGYVLKSSSPRDIAEAVKGVLHGQIVIDGTIIKSLTVHDTILGLVKKQVGKNSIREMVKIVKYGTLTKKESQILELIVQGQTMNEIAKTMNVSYNTMTVHFKHIYKKLDVHNRSAVIAKALKEKIVSL